MPCARSMPRVPRSLLVRLAAPPEVVGAAAEERLGAIPAGNGTFEIPGPPDRQPSVALTLSTKAARGATRRMR